MSEKIHLSDWIQDDFAEAYRYYKIVLESRVIKLTRVIKTGEFAGMAVAEILYYLGRNDEIILIRALIYSPKSNILNASHLSKLQILKDIKEDDNLEVVKLKVDIKLHELNFHINRLGI